MTETPNSPALFLDRDGVINHDAGYIHRIADFRFIDGIFDLCATARDLNYKLVVVTNQSGIGRGYYTEEDFHQLTAWMREAFIAHDVPLDAVYYCPFHPDGIGQYRKTSQLRKPAPGMLLKARDELGIDLATSVLIGDKESDIEAAHNAKLPLAIRFSDKSDIRSKADRIFSNHAQIAQFLTSFTKQQHSVCERDVRGQ